MSPTGRGCRSRPVAPWARIVATGTGVWMASTSSVTKPGSTDCTRHSARMRSPAEMRRATETVTCATTRAPRRRWPRALVADRVPSRRSVMSGFRHTRSAGMTPNPTPVPQVMSVANSSTRRSIAGSPTGSVTGTSRVSSGMAATAIPMPIAPPMAERRRLSVSSCRTSRSRPAPSAVRIGQLRSGVRGHARGAGWPDWCTR